MATGLVLACIINLSASYYGPAVVCIEARSENGDLEKIHKDLRALLSSKKIQAVSSIDTADNSIRLTFFVYNDMMLARCEAVLHSMVQNRDYSRIEYCIGY